VGSAPGAAEQQDSGPALDQLSFLDLLYAVPVGDLAMRVSGADLGRVSSADWSTLAVILAVIVLSWIGLHKNRAKMADDIRPHGRISEISFFSLRFVQFVIEVVIVIMYFAMGLGLKLPTTALPASPVPSESWLAGFLLGIFVTYLVWDCVDIRQAGQDHDQDWRARAKAGRRVTLIWMAPWAAIYLAVLFAPPHGVRPVLGLNLVLLAVLYGYRVAQDKRGNTAG
jgi:hypothetical protein